MPEHTSFLSYLAAKLFTSWDSGYKSWFLANSHDASGNVVDPCKVNFNAKYCSGMYKLSGSGEYLHHGVFEPILASIFIALVVLLFAVMTRNAIKNVEKAVVPESKLTVRTLVEYITEVFYDMLKEMMGGKRAKRYLPLIGTCALFIFFSNIATLIPGFSPPTSSWNVTFGCAIVVFVVYNYYGFKENGLGYLKHFMGPMLVLAPLIFVIEIISNCIRPITLSIRLMLNMAVDHLVLGIVIALIPAIVPLPLMVLGTLVAVVQTFVFCLLSAIYVSMATEHEH